MESARRALRAAGKWVSDKANSVSKYIVDSNIQVLVDWDARKNEIATSKGITYGSKYLRSDGFMIIVKLKRDENKNENVYYLLVNRNLSEEEDGPSIVSYVKSKHLEIRENVISNIVNNIFENANKYNVTIRIAKETVADFIKKIENGQYIKTNDALTEVESNILTRYRLLHNEPNSVFETGMPFMPIIIEYNSVLTVLKDEAIQNYGTHASSVPISASQEGSIVTSDSTPLAADLKGSENLGGKNKRVKKTNKKK